MAPVYLNDLGIICALGSGKAAVAEALFAADAPRGVAMVRRHGSNQVLALGAVNRSLPSLAALPSRLRGRTNAMLQVALEEIRPQVDAAIDRFGTSRVAVVLGTSTAGMVESERAQRFHAEHGYWPDDFDYVQRELGSPSQFLSHLLGVSGPAYSVSTACTASTKAMASAARLLLAGLADAVVTGGVDSLCDMTIAGFSALEAVAPIRCNPFSLHRNGINIGEGAALFVLTREPGVVRLAGWGESSDAYHMSAPDPAGRGASSALRDALQSAGVGAGAIDYINLHGTATMANDAMESKVVAEVFGLSTASSSTKPLTGHALGAAGAIDAALCWLTLVNNAQGYVPPHWWDGVADPTLPTLHMVAPGELSPRPLRYLLSHNFAFGGSNAALVLGAG